MCGGHKWIGYHNQKSIKSAKIASRDHVLLLYHETDYRKLIFAGNNVSCTTDNDCPMQIKFFSFLVIPRDINLIPPGFDDLH